MKNLFDGEGGTVIEEGQEIVTPFGTLCVTEDDIVVDGITYDFGDEVGEIDVVGDDITDVYLVEGDGYRGTGCYTGVGRYQGKLVGLDIVSEGMVFELIV